jgi:hypothetical protein
MPHASNLVPNQSVRHEWRADIGASRDALPIREVPGQLEALHSYLHEEQDQREVQECTMYICAF